MNPRDSSFEMRFAASFAGIGCALSFAGLVGCSALLDTGSLTGGRHASSGGGRSGGENSGASAEAGAAGDGSGNAGGDENSGGSSAQGGSAGASSGGANPGGGGSATGGGAAGVPETGGSAGGASCTKTNGGKEICDGLDNDCDPATPDCPAGCSAFSALGVHYMACGALAKWNSANVACLQQTMQLAQIRSSEENAAITTTLQDLHIAGPVWIGGESDPQNNSTFEWLDFTVIYQSGRPVAGVYQNFARNQPVAVNAATTLQMSTANDNSAGTWSNQLPSRSEAFVCKDFTL